MTSSCQFQFVRVECVFHWEDGPVKDTGQLAMGYWTQVISRQPNYKDALEHGAVLLLDKEDNGYRLKGHFVLRRGTAVKIPMPAHVVFGGATLCGASAVITIHNHPGGNPRFSPNDIAHARGLALYGELDWIKVKLLDFVAIGDGCFCSMAHDGLLAEPPPHEKEDPELKAAELAAREFHFASEVVQLDPALRDLVEVAAFKAKVSPAKYVYDLARRYTHAHVVNDNSLEARVVVGGHFLWGKEDQKDRLDFLHEAAADRGVDPFDYPLRVGVDRLEELYREWLATKPAPESQALESA